MHPHRTGETSAMALVTAAQRAALQPLVVFYFDLAVIALAEGTEGPTWRRHMHRTLWLLDDLGWSPDDPRTEYHLTMPPEELTSTLAWLAEGQRNLLENCDWSGPGEADEERDERHTLATILELLDAAPALA
ncbi:hypothetical protein NBH00_12800 [Paraconexibacter antarcticus]|uniref:Uncharacterized protein n=1 Tax=Paraconexibacter antarcticus TaxID=2949664 RepID=A0ABY5DN63_9ACTN|nr:hypothetical protein [Paraconexibacter antarcticus]UTI62247.1 hypothetical protein NBH00_12800 [Paraconexibacter antarcticus]